MRLTHTPHHTPDTAQQPAPAAVNLSLFCRLDTPPGVNTMVVEATPAELLEFLIDSARYGDTEDVVLAIKERVQVDGTDDAGRTGEC